MKTIITLSVPPQQAKAADGTKGGANANQGLQDSEAWTNDGVGGVEDANHHYASSQPTNDMARDEKHEVELLAWKDTRRIRGWRLALTAAMLLTATVVAVVSFVFLRHEEQDDFITAFDRFARTVDAAAGDQQRSLRAALTTMSYQYSLYAVATGATWPFVVFPSSELFARQVLQQSRAEEIALSNIVQHDDRENYTAFITEHYQDWMEESLRITPNPDFNDATGESYANYISKIEGFDFVPDDNRNEYFAFSMGSPPPSSYFLFNWNLGSIPAERFNGEVAIKLKNQTVLSEIRHYHTADVNEDHKKLHDASVGDIIQHPHCFAWQPVHLDPTDDDSEVVAFVTAPTAWDTFMRQLLPIGVKGLHCVIQNTCNQTFTYRIDGPRAIFLGHGDWHEEAYNHMAFESTLGANADPRLIDPEIAPGHCQYSMTIYPSSSFEAIYDSNTPDIFVAFVVVAFGLVIAIFFMYDRVVRHRNEKLIATAARSNTIVSSFFPKNIRDRLIGAEAGVVNTKQGQHSLKNYLSSPGTDVDAETPSENPEKFAGELSLRAKPLADLFLDTTIVFADIVGFTAWCSAREPFQVFTLLERVYAAFDAVAKCRGVFKVETVGDCYVAATGIPNKRNDHAVVMARFAVDIMRQMSVLRKQLEVKPRSSNERAVFTSRYSQWASDGWCFAGGACSLSTLW